MSKLLIKRGIAKFWPEHLSNRKIILLYHSIGNKAWGLSKHKFREQVTWLEDNCQIQSVNEILKSPYRQNIQVAISFAFKI